MFLYRQRLIITGVVQGVGFRPFVYGLALRFGLVGFVGNDSAGVFIEVEGEAAPLAAFREALVANPPPLAHIESVTVQEIAQTGDGAFTIVHSQAQTKENTLISPDITVCDDCLRELFDPNDRRYRYPFINCTNCGPRFTIIRDIPYDRPHTTMADFPMCAACQAEYDDPLNRRFHAQPNACPTCGPQVAFEWAESALDALTPSPSPNNRRGEHANLSAIEHAQQALAEGKIVAVKGLGGFHLACDATNDAALQTLRERKGRVDKPFAVMAWDIASVRGFAELSAQEERLLTKKERPIVLLRKKANYLLSELVAPHNPYIGVMLPYTPLHYLLLSDEGNKHARSVARILVMTSGNYSNEPIVKGNNEARERLTGLADAFLLHNREIHVQCDDSVVRIIEKEELPIRRSRGYAPFPVKLPFKRDSESVKKEKIAKGKNSHTADPALTPPTPLSLGARGEKNAEERELLPPLPEGEGGWGGEGTATFSVWQKTRPILAVGGELKSTFCLSKGQYAFMSQHIGDMENLETLNAFERAVTHFKSLFRIEPELIVSDKHPRYLSTKWAKDNQHGVPHLQVQHHHAHIASVMAEHGLDGSQPVIGFAFDGTGYGTDGAIWGGEVLIADYKGFTRAMHLKYVPLAGGDAAVKRPYRMALAHLWAAGIEWDASLPPVDACSAIEQKILKRQLERGLNSVPTSSMGRLFDAVASLAGVRQQVSYEAQAAIELEAFATQTTDVSGEAYQFDIQEKQFDAAPLIRSVANDVQAGVSLAIIAQKFHQAVAELILQVSLRLHKETGIQDIALSGGVFQNVTLLQRATQLLRAANFRVLTHRLVPPNDGGLALGQVMIGNRVGERESGTPKAPCSEGERERWGEGKFCDLR